MAAWFLQIVGKGASIARSYRNNIVAEASSTESDGQVDRQAAALETLAIFLERIANSGPDFLQRMKTADIGELLRMDGRALTPIFSAVMELVDDELGICCKTICKTRQHSKTP